MTREQLEHLIRASGDIANDDEIVVIGSQAILGQFPDAPADLLVSTEADVYPKNHPERADSIDGSIGELSPFHQTFGYYAQGVGPTTATLPDGWLERLVVLKNDNTRGVAGLCLEAHDLGVAKLVAGRDKDRRFLAAAIHHGLMDVGTLRARLATTKLTAVAREAAEATLSVLGR